MKRKQSSGSTHAWAHSVGFPQSVCIRKRKLHLISAGAFFDWLPTNRQSTSNHVHKPKLLWGVKHEADYLLPPFPLSKKVYFASRVFPCIVRQSSSSSSSRAGCNFFFFILAIVYRVCVLPPPVSRFSFISHRFRRVACVSAALQHTHTHTHTEPASAANWWSSLHD